MHFKSAKTVLYVYTLIIFFVLIGLYIYSKMLPTPSPFSISEPKSLLIVSTHQDDGVISAGGLAIINDSLGGKTTVAYILRPESDQMQSLRYQEAARAWGRLENNSADLKFLSLFPEELETKKGREQAIQKLSELINQTKPDLLVLPLREGGQRHHDIVSGFSKQIQSSYPNLQILKASEYNPILLTEKMPEKLLMFLVRLLPYVPYYTPNSGIDPNNQKVLSMSEKQLAQKKEMLLAFESQKDIIPLHQFGYPDLFDSSDLDDLVTIPLIGKQFSFSGLLILTLYGGYFIFIGIFISCHARKKSVRIIINAFALAPFVIAILNPFMFKENYILLSLTATGVLIFESLKVGINLSKKNVCDRALS